MNKPSSKNVAASVRSRLLNIARQTGKPFEGVLVLYGLERFLFRLSRSAHKGNFILKGGLLLMGLGFPQARPTRDIDLAGTIPGDIDSLSQAIQEIGRIACDDGLVYDFTDMSYEVMSSDSEYPGARVKFIAQLGQARIPIQIDIGFGDEVVPAPKEMEFPTLLDMEPPLVKSYSLETIIAEKFEAALDLAELNSRMKDFYDIWGLSRRFPFKGKLLQEAIVATCTRRRTTIRSDAEIFSNDFSDRPEKRAQWKAFINKGMMGDAPEDFVTLMSDIRTFLFPIAQASEYGQSFQGSWPEGGPWKK
jgi:predicted nucleotidyltransferase component of viral defense system